MNLFNFIQSILSYRKMNFIFLSIIYRLLKCIFQNANKSMKGIKRMQKYKQIYSLLFEQQDNSSICLVRTITRQIYSVSKKRNFLPGKIVTEEIVDISWTSSFDLTKMIHKISFIVESIFNSQKIVILFTLTYAYVVHINMCQCE